VVSFLKSSSLLTESTTSFHSLLNLVAMAEKILRYWMGKGSTMQGEGQQVQNKL
jgi:hypothetical protein